MILKVEIVGKNPDGAVRVIASDGRGFKYTGGVGEDIVEAMAGRPVAYFEADLTPHGIEIGDEVPEHTVNLVRAAQQEQPKLSPDEVLKRIR